MRTPTSPSRPRAPRPHHHTRVLFVLSRLAPSNSSYLAQLGTLYSRPSAAKEKRMHGCSGCLGGYVGPPPAALPENVNRTFKRRSIRRARGQPARSTQGNWMSSSHENEDNHSVLNSQALRKFSRSVNGSQEFGSASYNNDKSSFENHGLRRWHRQRQEWVGSQKLEQRGLRKPIIRLSSTYEELLGTSRPFTQPVPLPEMVDFLVDVWEQEGLYG